MRRARKLCLKLGGDPADDASARIINQIDHSEQRASQQPESKQVEARARLVGLWLSLYLPKALAIADSGKRCHPHDCAPATDGTAPPKRQRSSGRSAIAMGLGMLHWCVAINVTFRLPAKIGRTGQTHPLPWWTFAVAATSKWLVKNNKSTRCRTAAVVNPQKDADASAISTDTCRRNSSPW
jgi:hypothetical protein